MLPAFLFYKYFIYGLCVFNCMFKRCVMFVPKHKREYYGNNQSITCKSKPDAMPVFALIGMGEKLIYNISATDTSKKSAKSVYHHHKKALGTGPYFWCCLCFNK